MLKRAPKIFLVATSLAPIFLTIAFLEGRAGNLIACLILLCAVLMLMWTTTGLLKVAKRQLEVLPIQLGSARNADREVIAFLVAYVLPLAFGGPEGLKVDALAVGFVVLIFAMVVWGSHAYDFNPLLGFLGYHFFEVETAEGITYVLITKRPIVSVRQVTKVVQLTEYVLLDHS